MPLPVHAMHLALKRADTQIGVAIHENRYMVFQSSTRNKRIRCIRTLTSAHPVMRLEIATIAANPFVDACQRMRCHSIGLPALSATANCSCNQRHFLPTYRWMEMCSWADRRRPSAAVRRRTVSLLEMAMWMCSWSSPPMTQSTTADIGVSRDTVAGSYNCSCRRRQPAMAVASNCREVTEILCTNDPDTAKLYKIPTD